jgi:hypothetical protein
LIGGFMIKRRAAFIVTVYCMGSFAWAGEAVTAKVSAHLMSKAADAFALEPILEAANFSENTVNVKFNASQLDIFVTVPQDQRRFCSDIEIVMVDENNLAQNLKLRTGMRQGKIICGIWNVKIPAHRKLRFKAALKPLRGGELQSYKNVDIYEDTDGKSRLNTKLSAKTQNSENTQISSNKRQSLAFKIAFKD